MIRTRSATPLTPVFIEPGRGGGAHVWLRRNIQEQQEEVDGETHTVYTADEIYYYADAAPTVAEIEASFASHWLAHIDDYLTDRERLDRFMVMATDALAELGDMVAGGL